MSASPRLHGRRNALERMEGAGGPQETTSALSTCPNGSETVPPIRLSTEHACTDLPSHEMVSRRNTDRRQAVCLLLIRLSARRNYAVPSMEISTLDFGMDCKFPNQDSAGLCNGHGTRWWGDTPEFGHIRGADHAWQAHSTGEKPAGRRDLNKQGSHVSTQPFILPKRVATGHELTCSCSLVPCRPSSISALPPHLHASNEVAELGYKHLRRYIRLQACETQQHWGTPSQQLGQAHTCTLLKHDRCTTLHLDKPGLHQGSHMSWRKPCVACYYFADKALETCAAAAWVRSRALALSRGLPERCLTLKTFCMAVISLSTFAYSSGSSGKRQFMRALSWIPWTRGRHVSKFWSARIICSSASSTAA